MLIDKQPFPKTAQAAPVYIHDHYGVNPESEGEPTIYTVDLEVAQEVFDRFREMGVLRPVTQEPSSAVIEEIVDHQTDDLNVNMVTILRRPDQLRLKIYLQGGRLGSIIPVSKRAVVIGQEATQILR